MLTAFLSNFTFTRGVRLAENDFGSVFSSVLQKTAVFGLVSVFYRASAVAASPVLATIGMSVCPSVRPSVTR